MSRAALLDSYYLLSCALVFTLFLFQKGQGFFPSLPIAALLPRSWRWAGSTNANWDVTAQVGWLRCIHKQTSFPTHSWRWAYSTGAAWDASVRLGWFRSAKNGLAFFLCRWRYTCSTGAAWDNPV